MTCKLVLSVELLASSLNDETGNGY